MRVTSLKIHDKGCPVDPPKPAPPPAPAVSGGTEITEPQALLDAAAPDAPAPKTKK